MRRPRAGMGRRQISELGKKRRREDRKRTAYPYILYASEAHGRRPFVRSELTTATSPFRKVEQIGPAHPVYGEIDNF